MLINKSSIQSRKRKERIFKVDSEDMAYIGKNFGNDSSDNQEDKIFLGVKDKNSGVFFIFIHFYLINFNDNNCNGYLYLC